jgi:hypothetical protein
MSDVVKEFKKQTIEDAENTRCCLNCRYSYFQQYTEEGMCHNKELVRNVMCPKIVSEFFLCSHWQKK